MSAAQVPARVRLCDIANDLPFDLRSLAKAYRLGRHSGRWLSHEDRDGKHDRMLWANTVEMLEFFLARGLAHELTGPVRCWFEHVYPASWAAQKE